MNIVTRAAEWFSDPANWSGDDGIPNRVLEHLYYSGLALLIAALIALPLGLFVGHTGRGAFLAVNSAGAARALPTVGLVGLTVVVFGIGLTPTLLPLVALAIPPILVNTYAGVRQVDAQLRDAANGMGMTGPQVLFQVELPVALPLLILGLRTAAVQIVSTATIAAYVGLGGLGRYIFDGLARREYEVMVGGAVLSVLLALGTEALFVGVQRLIVSPGVQQRALVK
ncbi:ABC transporter permease [Cryptosporangium aurantiacum]|uniref:Osmoprotectant transport system permease protein n=1 Tax=Cryptosporangium aurantiacum TaxID=134849 RepID=A0A1M7PTL8_9ACTN|nr:ABC transporter permease [Cryptosporangium aurantiacum]SHN20758.1 osmoprotectant transport system permease protein [Cryptosporangium aurantiacum]